MRFQYLITPFLFLFSSGLYASTSYKCSEFMDLNVVQFLDPLEKVDMLLKSEKYNVSTLNVGPNEALFQKPHNHDVVFPEVNTLRTSFHTSQGWPKNNLTNIIFNREVNQYLLFSLKAEYSYFVIMAVEARAISLCFSQNINTKDLKHSVIMSSLTNFALENETAELSERISLEHLQMNLSKTEIINKALHKYKDLDNTSQYEILNKTNFAYFTGLTSASLMLRNKTLRSKFLRVLSKLQQVIKKKRFYALASSILFGSSASFASENKMILTKEEVLELANLDAQSRGVILKNDPELYDYILMLSYGILRLN